MPSETILLPLQFGRVICPQLIVNPSSQTLRFNVRVSIVDHVLAIFLVTP